MPRSTINGTAIDLDGKEMILDADQDTTITVDTDDQIDFKIAGTDTVHIISSGIGIGTASISSGFKLEVLGDVRFGDAYNDDAVELGWSSGASKGFVQAYDRGASSFRNLNLNNAVEIDSSGNVGIGTSSPATDFHVAGASYSAPTNGLDSNINLLINNTQYAGLGLLGANNGSSFIHFGDGDDMDVGQINYVHANNVMTFTTNTSEAMRIDSSGNVGIGETDISGFGGTYKGLDVAYKGSGLAGRTDNPTFDMRSNLFYDGSNYKYGEGSTSAGILSIGGNVLTFSNVPSGTAGATATVTERARINADGIFLLGTTTTSDTSGVGFKARPTGSITGTFNTSASDTSGFHYYNTNGTNNGYRFYVRADGGIYNYSSANYNLSDEREKKNIVDMGSHYEDFKKFKFRDFNYNTEEDSQPKKHGVIAQEVELVNSNLVGEDFKVKVDEDGKDVLRKGLKEEQFVMIGLKTLQETIIKMEALEARIKKLEGS